MKKYVTIHTQCVNKRGEKMEIKDKIKELRESTGMNRRNFVNILKSHTEQ